MLDNKNTQIIAMFNLGEERVRIHKGTAIARFSYVKRNRLEIRPRDERVEEVRMETDITPGSPEEEAKLTELWQQPQMEENPLLAERPDVKEMVRQVLRKHWKVFS